MYQYSAGDQCPAPVASYPSIHHLLLQPLFLAGGICSGGEDFPNAYRRVPMSPDQSDLAVVAYYKRIAADPRFCRYSGSPFVLPNSVCSFNRFPRFFQAACRRLGFCLASMYFDGLTVQDLGRMKGPAQHFIASLATHPGSIPTREAPGDAESVGLPQTDSRCWCL